MKKYEIRYFMDKDNYVTRSVNEEDEYTMEIILHEYTKGDYQTFPDGRSNLTRINMNQVFFTKIFESKR